jgi:hypothetical protein
MTKENYEAMQHVRKEIWTNGMYGYVIGASVALLLHAVARRVPTITKTITSTPLNGNTLILAFFGGGTLGSFTAASVAGKNHVHQLHDIFPKGARPPPPSSS